LEVPVKNANIVPSIPLGVILAKRAKIGSVPKDNEIAPNTTSVNIKKK
jgi:hypothetical protein